MKLWLIGGALGLSLLASGPAEPEAEQPAKSAWLTDYKEARALARRTGKPLFVVFR